VTRARTLALAALATLAAAAPAAAAPYAPLDILLFARGGRVLASLNVGKAFPPAVERELGNGLTNVVAVYVAAIPAAGGPPSLVHGRVIDILFDVWEEDYVVVVKDPQNPQGVRAVLRNFAALRAFLSNQRDLDLGPASLLPEGAFVVEARVEVNPVSKEQLLRTREFIANPSAGSGASGGGSRSVLGAMASFLLREPAPGSDVSLFRSRAFAREEVVAR
jgi:hypothetical protein